MDSPAPALTVVVLSFNEERSFDATCRELLDTLSAVPGLDAELLVVDDGSTDGTSRLADALAARDARVRVVHHAVNLGLGGVYRTGFREARGDYVTFFPADGQFPASIIPEFLARMHNHDMVLGVAHRKSRSPLSVFLSFAERVLYSVLFGRMPPFQGVLMFRRELLARHQLRSTGRGWAVLLEFILRCSRDDCRMVSVPTDVRARAHGSSKVNNLRTIWSNLRQTLALRRVLANEHAI